MTASWKHMMRMEVVHFSVENSALNQETNDELNEFTQGNNGKYYEDSVPGQSDFISNHVVCCCAAADGGIEGAESNTTIYLQNTLATAGWPKKEVTHIFP